MKIKLFALILAGAMVSGTIFCAAQEETENVSKAAAEETENVSEAVAEETEALTESAEVVEVTMDMLEDTAYEGAWVSFAEEFDLYLPSSWDILEIAEEDAEEGLLFQTVAPDESGLNIVVMATEIGTGYTLEMVKEELEEIGFANTVYVAFNDIPTVAFETETTAGVAFLDDAGIMYNVQVGPSTDEAFEAIATNLFYSLSMTEVHEAETEAE